MMGGACHRGAGRVGGACCHGADRVGGACYDNIIGIHGS